MLLLHDVILRYALTEEQRNACEILVSKEFLELGCSCCFAGHLQVSSLECQWSNTIPSLGVTGRNATNSTDEYVVTCVLKMDFMWIFGMALGIQDIKNFTISVLRTVSDTKPMAPSGLVLKRPWYLQVSSLEFKVTAFELRLGAWLIRSTCERQKRKQRWWRVISTNDLNWSSQGKRWFDFFEMTSLGTKVMLYRGNPCKINIMIIIIIIILTTLWLDVIGGFWAHPNRKEHLTSWHTHYFDFVLEISRKCMENCPPTIVYTRAFERVSK